MTDTHVIRIERIGLTVRDLAASRTFYERALGFREVERLRRSGPDFAALMDIPELTAEVSVMRLGAQEIELVAYQPAGRAYPAQRSAADPWFQHFAIVTADMDAAYASLSAQPGWTPISTSGPQLLPPATGSITAFKFRDPNGHPLELSYFPPAVAGDWRASSADPIFLGIDHSALAVSDIDASTRFYVECLGFRQTASQINSGPEQARLDGLAGATVAIVSLETASPGPHIELLDYRSDHPTISPATAPVPAPNDVAATRLIVTALRGDTAALASDPDGHMIELRPQ